jgi:transcriptional regulator with XRE-family HTH domain
MSYGFPGGGVAAKFDTNAGKIKTLRTERAWTQEHLAEAAGIAYRTVQRIEATGRASMESIRALANAFGIDSSELLRPVAKAAEGPTPKARSDASRFLVRINSGADLFAIVGGAHAGSVENEELKSEAEVELVGGFLQEMADWGEMWSELEPGERVRQNFEFTQKLKELDEAGFVVFGTREKRAVRVADSVIPDWNVAIIRVLRSTNPAVVHLSPEGGTAEDATNVTEG